MITGNMPGCCVGRVIYQLDSEYERQHEFLDLVKPTSKEKIETDIKQILRLITASFVLATTNSNQLVAEEVLEAEGFKRIDSVPSTNHDTMVTVWYKNLLTEK